MSIVSNIVSAYLPAKKKTTPSGWISFNAPCCHHNGHAHDTRGRGGLMLNGDDSVSYHCFNCGFKCSWQSGRNLSLKFKNFLSWIGVPDTTINQLSLQLIKQDTVSTINAKSICLPEFKNIKLPAQTICINDVKNPTTEMIPILNYIVKRNVKLNNYTYYWNQQLGYKDRIIIPFYYKENLVGYTARSINNKNPKYLTNSQPGYVFNLDIQQTNWNYIILCEGPFDAISIDGVSILGSEISEKQKLLLETYKKEIIVVPDRDKAGKKLYLQALDLGWSLSFPPWDNSIKDIADAVDKYGKLLTLCSIIKYKQQNLLKIKLGAKKWFG